MALLLHIDTATEQASVCLSRDETILGLTSSSEQKNHAGFVQPAIEELMRSSGCKLSELDAVSVTAGPGSYTGLRVGLATAKGICYALQKPLILINTLEVMAHAMLTELTAGPSPSPDTWICPLIDARRMEVFTALYNLSLAEIEPPKALILETGSFDEMLGTRPVFFGGSGSAKLKPLLNSPNASFSHSLHTAADLAVLALKYYRIERFANLAYSEPLYVKEFFNPLKKV
jgi:tRNA threonylcarbamoyladenosine biosynthesis protein TsaB